MPSEEVIPCLIHHCTEHAHQLVRAVGHGPHNITLIRCSCVYFTILFLFWLIMQLLLLTLAAAIAATGMPPAVRALPQRYNCSDVTQAQMAALVPRLNLSLPALAAVKSVLCLPAILWDCEPQQRGPIASSDGYQSSRSLSFSLSHSRRSFLYLSRPLLNPVSIGMGSGRLAGHGAGPRHPRPHRQHRQLAAHCRHAGAVNAHGRRRCRCRAE